MKHIRMFENAQQAVDVLAELQYPTLSAIRGESGIALKPGVPDPKTIPFYIDVRGPVTLAATTGLQMSTDGTNWTDTTDDTVLQTGKTYFRVASNQSYPLKPNWTENDSSDYDIGGNINSLVMPKFINNTSSYKFATYFSGKSKLKSASNLVLPATALTYESYKEMFKNCTSLTKAPALTATRLGSYCYDSMFSGCTSLTQAPELPVTALATYCYRYMFQGCTSLTVAPTLPATTLAESCYQGMFKDCTSLTTAPELPVTTLSDICYSNMFQGCTSLTTAPELPATKLTRSCYTYMFQGCTSLTTAPELPATTLMETCYAGMFKDCTSLTTVPSILPATNLPRSCYSYMFQGCTSLTTAPELPATTLYNYCYESMFKGCTKLNYIKCLATNISASGCTNFWVQGVASKGTFVKAASMSGWTTGANGIPSGWTVQNA